MRREERGEMREFGEYTDGGKGSARDGRGEGTRAFGAVGGVAFCDCGTFGRDGLGLLAWAAHRALGEKALSVTALSESYSAYDREQGGDFPEGDGSAARICGDTRIGESGVTGRMRRTGATTARTNFFPYWMDWRRSAGLGRWLTE